MTTSISNSTTPTPILYRRTPAELSERVLPEVRKYLIEPRRTKPERVFPGRWRDWTAGDKFLGAGDLAELSKGRAVTFHLGDREHAAAMKHSDPMAYVMKRINTALRKAGLTDLRLAVALGLSDPMKNANYPRGRLHVHGLVIPGSHDFEMVQRALRAAGGRVLAAKAARQFGSRRVCHGRGAAEYALNAYDIRTHAEERRRLAKTFPGAETFKLNRAMNAAVRDAHEAQRRSARASKVSSEVENDSTVEKVENKPVQRHQTHWPTYSLVPVLWCNSVTYLGRLAILLTGNMHLTCPLVEITCLGQPPPGPDRDITLRYRTRSGPVLQSGA